MKKIILFLAIGSILPLSTLGHGLGQSLEQPAGDYIANLEYNRLELSAGETTTFGLNLLDRSRKPADFSSVLFEIYADDKTLLSVFVDRPEDGEAAIDYFFVEGGSYSVAVKFVNDGKGIAETSFDLIVESVEEQPWYRQPFFIATIIVIAAGVAAAFIAYRLGKKSRK